MRILLAFAGPILPSVGELKMNLSEGTKMARFLHGKKQISDGELIAALNGGRGLTLGSHETGYRLELTLNEAWDLWEFLNQASGQSFTMRPLMMDRGE